MAPIKSIEYFRVMPRWLFVKIVDIEGNYGWGEATLEGHTEAIEGTLDGFIKRFTGLEADNIEHIWQLAWRQSKSKDSTRISRPTFLNLGRTTQVRTTAVNTV